MTPPHTPPHTGGAWDMSGVTARSATRPWATSWVRPGQPQERREPGRLTASTGAMQETGGRRARARRQGAGMTFRVGYVIDHELAYEAVVFDDGSSGDGLSIQRALEHHLARLLG